MSEDQAGWPWSSIACGAYRAYAASTRNKNFRGDPMPEFVDLPRPIQIAWEAAVRHAADIIAAPVVPATDPANIFGNGSERRWAGWVPPEDRHER